MKKITGREISAYCRGLEVLLGGGTSCEEAVLAMCEEKENTIAALVQAHFSFSLAQAVEAAGIFPEYMVEMVRAGEDSGRLEEVLGELSVYFENTSAMEERVKSAVVQPMISLVVMCILLFIMATQVLPIFARVYKSLSGGMDVYLGLSMGIAWTAFALSALLTVMVAVLFILWRGGGRGKEKCLALLRRLPFASAYSYEAELARFTSVLSIYISAAVDTETAFHEAEKVVALEGLQAKLAACKAKISAGAGFGRAAREAGVYKPIYGKILQNGGATGREGESVQYIAAHEWADADEKLGRAANGIEPLLSGAITLSVAVLLVSAMLPLIGIMSSIG